MKSVEEQLKIIKKGTLDIINEEELIKINDFYAKGRENQ